MGDLIERLRSDQFFQSWDNEAADQLEAQQAEIEGLREALREIASIHSEYVPDDLSIEDHIFHEGMAEGSGIAREALDQNHDPNA